MMTMSTKHTLKIGWRRKSKRHNQSFLKKKKMKKKCWFDFFFYSAKRNPDSTKKKEYGFKKALRSHREDGLTKRMMERLHRKKFNDVDSWEFCLLFFSFLSLHNRWRWWKKNWTEMKFFLFKFTRKF